MADILDDADKASEMFQLEALTRKHKAGPAPMGECWCCGEPFPEGSMLRFCDADCRDYFESLESLRAVRFDDRNDVEE